MWNHTPLVYPDPVTPYELMTPTERTTFAGLVRLMTRMDGVFSKEEVQTIAEVAREIGEPELWSLLNQSVSLEHEELMGLVDEVRPQMRRWIHGILLRVAEADGVDETEQDLLWWLENRWELAPVSPS